MAGILGALSASKLAEAPAAALKVAECYPAIGCARCDPACRLIRKRCAAPASVVRPVSPALCPKSTL